MQADWRASPVIEPPEKGAERSRRVDLLNLNLMPARHRPSRLSLADIAPWVASLGLALLVLPIFSRFQEVNRSYQALRSESAAQQRLLDGESEAQLRIEIMQAELGELQAEIGALAASYDAYRIQQVAWNSELSAVAAELPRATSLIRLDQNGSSIRIRGESAEYQLVLVYAGRLAALPDVIDLAIERIGRISPASGDEDGQEGESQTEQPRFAFEFLLTMSSSNSLQPQETAGNGPEQGPPQ